MRMGRPIRFARACNPLVFRRGFTLVEMSVVLIIAGLVVMMIFPALKALRESAQRGQTATNLFALARATAAFVQANGCLPCPTPAGATGARFGRVRGDANPALCGVCSVAEGLPPFASLGLPLSSAKDGWGRWITMRVDPALTVAFGVVPPTLPCTASDPQTLCPVGTSRKGLCSPSLSAANRIKVQIQGGGVQEAAVLFLSHGPNGYGAFRSDPVMGGANAHPAFAAASPPCTTTSGFELCNANGDASFVDAQATNDPLAPYDDALMYFDRKSIVSYLGNPACQAEW